MPAITDASVSRAPCMVRARQGSHCWKKIELASSDPLLLTFLTTSPLCLLEAVSSLRGTEIHQTSSEFLVLPHGYPAAGVAACHHETAGNHRRKRLTRTLHGTRMPGLPLLEKLELASSDPLL